MKIYIWRPQNSANGVHIVRVTKGPVSTLLRQQEVIEFPVGSREVVILNSIQRPNPPAARYEKGARRIARLEELFDIKRPDLTKLVAGRTYIYQDTHTIVPVIYKDFVENEHVFEIPETPNPLTHGNGCLRLTNVQAKAWIYEEKEK